jgi:hypothetical protein
VKFKRAVGCPDGLVDWDMSMAPKLCGYWLLQRIE